MQIMIQQVWGEGRPGILNQLPGETDAVHLKTTLQALSSFNILTKDWPRKCLQLRKHIPSPPYKEVSVPLPSALDWQLSIDLHNSQERESRINFANEPISQMSKLKLREVQWPAWCLLSGRTTPNSEIFPKDSFALSFQCATCAVAQDPELRRAPHSVWCSAIAAWKFLISEQRALQILELLLQVAHGFWEETFTKVQQEHQTGGLTAKSNASLFYREATIPE